MKSTLMTAVIFGSLAIPVFAQPEQAKTFTGVVSDNMCGKQHMANDKSAAQCTRECVKAGSDYALVVGDKVYTLKARMNRSTNSSARERLSQARQKMRR